MESHLQVGTERSLRSEWRRIENFDPVTVWWRWPWWPEKLFGLEYSGGRLEEEKDLKSWWRWPEMEDGINFVVALMAALLLRVLWRIVMAMREKRRMKNDRVSGEGMERECSFCRERREE